MPRHEPDADALRLAGAAVRRRLAAARPDAAAALAGALPREVTLPASARGRDRDLLAALGVGFRAARRPGSVGSGVCFVGDPPSFGTPAPPPLAAYERLLGQGGAVISTEGAPVVAGALAGGARPAPRVEGPRSLDAGAFVPWMGFRRPPRWHGGAAALPGEAWGADTEGRPLVTASRGGRVVHLPGPLYDSGMRALGERPDTLVAESLVGELLAVDEAEAAAVAGAAGLRGAPVHVAWGAWLMAACAALAEALARALAGREAQRG